MLEKLIKHTKDKSYKILSESPAKDEAIKTQLEAQYSSNHDLKKEAMEIFKIGTAKKSELIGGTNIRMITLKQLKDIISEIYENKEKHDDK
jgi:hypothetical protein